MAEQSSHKSTATASSVDDPTSSPNVQEIPTIELSPSWSKGRSGDDPGYYLTEAKHRAQTAAGYSTEAFEMSQIVQNVLQGMGKQRTEKLKKDKEAQKQLPKPLTELEAWYQFHRDLATRLSTKNGVMFSVREQGEKDPNRSFAETWEKAAKFSGRPSVSCESDWATMVQPAIEKITAKLQG